MHRLRLTLLAACFAGLLFTGCGGEDQLNAPARPEEVNADFGKNAGEMMKNANAGSLDKAAIRKAAAGGATTPAPK